MRPDPTPAEAILALLETFPGSTVEPEPPPTTPGHNPPTPPDHRPRETQHPILVLPTLPATADRTLRAPRRRMLPRMLDRPELGLARERPSRLADRRPNSRSRTLAVAAMTAITIHHGDGDSPSTIHADLRSLSTDRGSVTEEMLCMLSDQRSVIVDRRSATFAIVNPPSMIHDPSAPWCMVVHPHPHPHPHPHHPSCTIHDRGWWIHDREADSGFRL